MNEVFTAASHHEVLVLLIQITVLLFAARAMGEFAQRLGQPTVVGEILAGIVLGPSLLSGLVPAVGEWIVPHTETQGYLLEVVGLFGAMFLLLITGLETDLALIRRHARTAMGASLGGILLPFATGYALGWYLPDAFLANPERRLVFALFVATAMSISAIPVIAKVLMDLNLMRRDIGQTILAAGMTDDAIGWMLLSVVLGLASGEAVSAGTLLLAVAKVVGFVALTATVGRWLVQRSLSFVQDRAVSPYRLLSLVVILTFGWGVISQGLGLEAMLGAFVMGILLGRMPRLPHHVYESVERIALGVFAPVFFAVAGLKVNARALLDPQLLLVAVIVILVASFGKVVGGYAGARFMGGAGHWTALAFGVGLNARGAMEIIIATIGLRMGILNQEMFSVIVVMAITTSVMAPPALRWALRHIRMGSEEANRLQQEELAKTSLLAGVRRVLVPVRCSLDERRALLTLESHLLERMHARTPLAVTLFTVTGKEDHARASDFLGRLSGRFPGMEVTTRVVDGEETADVILDEANKDYDLMILSTREDDPRTPELFSPLTDYLTRLSPCPTLVVKGRLSEQHWPPERILVPTNGSTTGRNAADVAFALADGQEEVHILNVVEREVHVRRTDVSGAMMERQMRAARGGVEELQKIGELSGVQTLADVRTGTSPEVVILRTAEEEEIDLIVLGTNLHPGSDHLFLGPRVERILNSAPCPVVVVNAS